VRSIGRTCADPYWHYNDIGRSLPEIRLIPGGAPYYPA
jgi:hypothetical protein